MEYSKIYENIDDTETKFWIKFVPDYGPSFLISGDGKKVFAIMEDGLLARASMEMASEFGYEPGAF
ncbi:MAG: hypothetical protein ABFD08_02920 [Syntrophomonas sp.]